MGIKDKLCLLIPIEELEQEAQNQIWEALALPFLKKLAIMPDCHTGYHLPIGGVALLHKVVSPSYVGYDIGCGMCCIITDIDFPDWSTRDMQEIQRAVMDVVPVGVNGNSPGTNTDYKVFESWYNDKNLNEKVNAKLNAQLGTLGSGR